jgi:hypothetical protein
VNRTVGSKDTVGNAGQGGRRGGPAERSSLSCISSEVIVSYCREWGGT